MFNRLTKKSRQAVSRLYRFTQQHPAATVVDYFQYRERLQDPVTAKERAAIMTLCSRDSRLQLQPNSRQSGAWHTQLVIKGKKMAT